MGVEAEPTPHPHTMAARIAIARAVHFSTPRRAACAALRPQIRTQCLQSSRQFSVISALRAKRYAADALGDVIYVELPQEGLETNAGDSIGAVESVKSANDIITPVPGKVIEANNALEGKPSTLNKDPEGEGWVAKLEIEEDGVATFEGLMDTEAYKAFTEEAKEEH